MNVREFYDLIGGKYLNIYKSNGMELVGKEEIKFVLSNLPKKKNILVLEIGTGPGRISREVVKFGVKFIGVDISKKMIDECRKKLKNFKNVELVQCDVSKGLPFKSEIFDFVYATRVLKYVKNLDDILHEINRVLKKGGLFVFDMPNKHSINILNIFHKIPYKRISKIELIRILNKCGFSIIRIEYGPKLPDIFYDNSNKFTLKMILKIEQILKMLLGCSFSRFLHIIVKKYIVKK